MDIDLTIEDMDLIAEALAAWETTPVEKNMIVSLITMALVPNNNSDEAKLKIQEGDDKADKEKQRRAEVSVLLRAKLIQLKNKLHVDYLIQR